jgi:tRNA threonylcarbamoyladenosine biosynthesis protein TsaB
MKMLAVDTSTLVLGVALLDEEKLYGEWVTNQDKNHSVRLMPAIGQLMAELGWTPQDLEGIAVAKGPGSYTGLRIGVATAKSLAWALSIPLFGVSTLAAMAVAAADFSGVIVPLIDARRGRVYTGLYAATGDYRIVDSIEADRVIDLDDWVSFLAEHYREREVLLVGEEAGEFIQVFVNAGLTARQDHPIRSTIKPGAVGLLGLGRWRQGLAEDIHHFAPAYLQPTEAEAKLQNGKK